MTEINKIFNENCLSGLNRLDDNSIQCCVTSPPYFGLRDYGHEDQIGLEETPEKYVETLVEVFTEVKRVLKKDGTLWLNLGDSYCGSSSGSGSGSAIDPNSIYFNAGLNVANVKKSIRTKLPGLKSKDLIGIPWMVAFALRKSQYTGRIKNEKDRIWLAAMIDGEGCFYIHKRKEGQHAGDGYFRKNDSYACAIEVANTHRAIIDKCYEITGVGSVTCQYKDRRQPLFRWTVRCDEAKKLAAELYPYIVAKQQQCRIIHNLPSSGKIAESSWEAMKQLHAGIETDIDFPEPKIKLYEDGWFLRQDCIWSKPNPMPESVTDRCTKSHEYIFLLSKSNKYFFNAESIKIDSLTQEYRHAGVVRNRLYDYDSKENNNPRAYMKTINRKDKDGTDGFRDTGIIRCGDPSNGKANKRSVWTIPTYPYSDAHFATFPEDLIVDCIKAGTKEGDLILDPFMGAGTTALVARKLNRNFIGFEINVEYVKIAEKRLRGELGMFHDA